MKLKVLNKKRTLVIEFLTDRLFTLYRIVDGEISRTDYGRHIMIKPADNTLKKMCGELGYKFLEIIDHNTDEQRWFDFKLDKQEFVLNRPAKLEYLRMENEIKK